VVLEQSLCFSEMASDHEHVDHRGQTNRKASRPNVLLPGGPKRGFGFSLGVSDPTAAQFYPRPEQVGLGKTDLGPTGERLGACVGEECGGSVEPAGTLP
jgi:hypothetical protein